MGSGVGSGIGSGVGDGVGDGVGEGVGVGSGAGTGATGHEGKVHGLVLVNAGHSAPPFAGGVVTTLVLFCSPTRSGTGESVKGSSQAFAAATRA